MKLTFCANHSDLRHALHAAGYRWLSLDPSWIRARHLCHMPEWVRQWARVSASASAHEPGLKLKLKSGCDLISISIELQLQFSLPPSIHGQYSHWYSYRILMPLITLTRCTFCGNLHLVRFYRCLCIFIVFVSECECVCAWVRVSVCVFWVVSLEGWG